MTADELASFRALLRAQVEAPQRRPRFFSLRERPAAPIAAPQATAPPRPVSAPITASDILLLTTAPADPPLRAPPLFGRREVEADPVTLVRDTRFPLAASAEPLMLLTPLATAASHLWEVPAAAPEPEPAPPPKVAPGGWTRARPPSAQRRLLARLEAVFLAERLGLDARREAQRG